MPDFINGYFQREPAAGITVYTIDLNTGEILIQASYSSWRSYVTSESEIDVKMFYKNNLYDRPTPIQDYYSYPRRHDVSNFNPKGPLVAYWNADGSLFPTDEIIGDIRNSYDLRAQDYKKRYGRDPYWWTGGGRYGFGGGNRQKGKCYRRVQVFNEKKQWGAWDDEYPVKARQARNIKNLPDPWDDYCRQYYSNWKDSTKRKRQWKPK